MVQEMPGEVFGEVLFVDIPRTGARFLSPLFFY